MKTVKEMSRLSGVSVRTLHYYDQIGLLKPNLVGNNGYRYYGETEIERLQEILLFKELEFSLKDIKEIVTDKVYNAQEALEKQILFLEAKKEHLETIIVHAKSLRQKGDSQMDFSAFDKTELEKLKQEAKDKWGDTQAYQNFSNKDEDLFEKANQEMMAIFKDFHQLIGHTVSDKVVQDKVKELQALITKRFYPCNKDILAHLGIMYQEDSRFSDAIEKHSGHGTVDFVSKAIAYYCQL